MKQNKLGDKMQKKKVIGILPMYNLTNEDNDPYLDQAKFVTMYSKKIRDCGGIPIGILEENLVEYTSICDGYLWPGGNKIYYSFNYIIEDCIKNHKPLLGVCMGMQAITTYFNILEDQKKLPGKSFREVYDLNKKDNPYLLKLNDENINTHLHYVTKDQESINAARHKVNILNDSFLSDIYKNNGINCASMHSYVISRVPECLSVVAKGDDGIIEGIEYNKYGSLILGVQWHPENREPRGPDGTALPLLTSELAP